MRWAALPTLAATWLLSSANGHAADRLSAPALKPAPVPMPSSPTTVVMTNGMAAPDYAACLSDLARTGAVYQPLGDLTKEGCALSGAVQLQSVATNFGAVTISGEPIMLCSFARQFVSWVRDIGAPLTLAYTGARLTTIETGPGFVCRNRYNQPDAKISEHAKGNAIESPPSFFPTSNRFRSNRSRTIRRMPRNYCVFSGPAAADISPQFSGQAPMRRMKSICISITACMARP